MIRAVQTKCGGLLRRLRHRFMPPMTKEQAELLSSVKFPCC